MYAQAGGGNVLNIKLYTVTNVSEINHKKLLSKKFYKNTEK